MIKGFITAALLLAASPALAWENEDKDGGCAVSQVFEGAGDTVFALRQDSEWFSDNDSVFVLIQNDNWTTGNGNELGVIRFETDEGWFENTGLGMEVDGLQGYIGMTMPFDLVATALNGSPKSMVVTRDGKLIDSLSLSGFSYPWIKFKDCRQKKVSANREIERQNNLERNIPKNPFGN